MPEPVFVIVRDARGSLVHVRRRDDGQCFGCIEVGLYEIVRAVVLADEAVAAGVMVRWPPPRFASVERAAGGKGEPTSGEIGERSG